MMEGRRILVICAVLVLLIGCGRKETGENTPKEQLVVDVPMKAAMHKEETSEDSSIDREVNVTKPRTSEMEKEVLWDNVLQPEEEPASEEEPVLEKESVSEEEPMSKKEPVPKEAPASKEEPVSEKKSVPKEEPAPEEESTSKKELKPEKEPVPKEELTPEKGAGSEAQNDGEEKDGAEGKEEVHSCVWDAGTVKNLPSCEEDGLRIYQCVQCKRIREEKIPSQGHSMTTQWFGDAPTCTHGGYQAVLCDVCGWVDETACHSVAPLEHTPTGKEIQHGNCREDTIIVYTCSECGEQTGYERYPETEEHAWVIKETQVWDEEVYDFVTILVECCERCNLVMQEEA